MRNRSVPLDPRSYLQQIVQNRYRIEELIGQGGMGYVYRATDLHTGAVCAVKMFLPKKNSELSSENYHIFLQRFKREYKIMDEARHQHIIQVHDRGEYRGAAYFVMDFFEKGSLFDLMGGPRRFSARQVCLYMRQVASALDYIHAKGTIHRDVKPQNMLIGKRGQLFLADFGVAHILGSDLTLTDQPGTKVYKSPQAKVDMPPDRRDDIYSLGIVLYELLSGNEPHLRDIRRMGPEIAPAVWPIIQKATADAREDRYASAGEMAEELEEALLPPPKSGGSLNSRAGGQLSRQGVVRKRPPGVQSPRGTLFSRLRFGVLLLVVVLALVFLVQRATARPNTITLVFPSATAVVHAVTPASQGQTPTQGQTSASNQAEAVVQEYYTDWNQQNYQAAYDLLQSAYQQRNAFSTLLSAYQHTHHACITITGADPQADGSVQVQVTDSAIEDAATGGTIVNLYYVVYDVRLEQQNWRIAPLSLQYSAGVGTCSP